MPVSIMSADGRLTVPKEIRQAVKAMPGTEFLWVLLRGGVLQVVPKTGKIEDLAGMLTPGPGITVSVEEMNPFR
ncbi:AbrB family transcriptional regulator [Roseateles chitinivorans]|uniref:AbrB family transcriptional regulator n=1 Tax=Roseateles chitinivorans TaxID=2917965 RepID=A0A2G9C3A3_9BURK|nr:AbrB family transcriptional regulator [Roseateles chitinivorans]PIM50842.1 AbrB family transcriptional regulator [Roseateles chitinivorans]